MNISYKIVHITDLHISEDGSPVRDIDVRGNFLAVLESAGRFMPDLVVLGGDLAAEEGELGAYYWIKEVLTDISIPYVIVPGNHDVLLNLDEVFDIKDSLQQSWDFIWQNDDLVIIGLDSSKGEISNQQLHWLHKSFKSLEKDALLFMHHPPIDCGCAFMDTNYPLFNRKDVFHLISDCSQVAAVFCGHYHTEKTVIRENKQIYLTPATMMQMSQTSSSYEVDSLRPGWRLIEWTASKLSTRVIYLD